MANEDTSRDISVQRDGIKLGWNILASLAVMAIGMYVYMVLAPIKGDIGRIALAVTDISAMQNELHDTIDNLDSEVDDRIDDCEKAEAILEGRILTLENALNRN